MKLDKDHSMPFDLHDWLSIHGLTEYEMIFRENNLDKIELLAELKEEDLKELGVSSIGHRKAFSIAIEELGEREEFGGNQEATDPREETRDSSSGPWGVVGWLLVVVLIIIILGAIGI